MVGFHYKYQYKPVLLIIKTIKNGVLLCVLGHIPLGFNGFNKPPIEGDQLPVETHRVHYSFH